MDATAVHSEPRLLTHRDARAIVFGVLLPVFMGSLDTTILASALPTIGRELGNVHALPWLMFATMLVAIFGAIVLGSVDPGQVAPGTFGLQRDVGSSDGFARVFLAAAACFTVSFFALLILQEKPLQTDVSPNAS